jgi:DNA polymerase II small subunit
MPVRDLLSSLESRGSLLSPQALALLEDGSVDAEALRERLLSRDELPMVVGEDLVRDLAGSEGSTNGGSPASANGGRPGETSPDPASPGADGGQGPDPDPPASGGTVGEGSAEAQGAAASVPEAGPAPGAGPADGDGATGPSPEGANLAGVVDRAPGGDEDEAPVDLDPGEIPDVEYEAPEDAMPSTEPVESFDVGGFDHDIQVLEDVTGESTCEGELDDFTRYFNDRLRRLRKLLGKRREMVGMVPIEKANESRSAEITFAGLVKDVRTTSSGGRLLELEDETDVALVFAPDDDEDALRDADAVVEDEVVGVVVSPGNRTSDLLILDEIVHPGVPHQRTRATADREVAACFISDVHVGARTFLPEDWERFVRWINGQWGSPQMKGLARKVRYLVVAGDIVDGVGIFPGQREELAVPDGEEQYRIAGEQLARLRDDLGIVVSPGNHDLVRQAEPQPALPEKYAKHFPDNVTRVANPCLLEIEGVRVLVYHGTGIDDWIQRVRGLSYQEPVGTMKEMLRRHHLLPMYGLKTPIAPEPRDHLAVDSVPDVFVTGHVHTADLESWRDVTLLNSSCWQGQTPFQKRQGIVPEPGRAPVVELDTGDTHMLNFHREGDDA